ncbi:unnamed protein product [Prorocentrum cordatum]|uniref:K Homology domain-containing protein n=1 Tax=Prorocentrum cordatum TaxID=2364126 RepID=A0ABN9V432_9DINO|nr:unnamed protein product [Polarella glacialis]
MRPGMALAPDCGTSVEARSVVCLLCLSSLPAAGAREPPAKGAEAAPGAYSACEALVQGLLIGVLAIATAALRDRCGSALRSLRARPRSAPQDPAPGEPAGAAAGASGGEPPAGSAAAASPQGRGGRPAVFRCAKGGRGRGSPAAAGESGGFGEMLAAARSRAPESPGGAPAAGAAGSSPAQRLALPRPGRGARVLQMRAKVGEFDSLRFDEVDTTEQMGLTCRMLATLKSFAQDVTYWEEDRKIDEPAFRLLDLDEVAQFALLRAAERAEALVEERCWREAYRELCAARPWLPRESRGGPAAEQRAAAEAEMARAEERARREDAELEALPRKDPCSSSSSAADGSPGSDSVAIIVRLPEGGTSRVLGQKAATLAALRAETGARVWLDQATGEAHVSGPAGAVEAARRGIKFLLTPVKGGEADGPLASAPPPTVEKPPASAPPSAEKEGSRGPSHVRRRR